jgi:protein-tyrosine phosphatase
MRTKAAGPDLIIDSAGTGAWHRGSPPDPRSRAAGEARGYDFTGITARQVAETDFTTFDHILAMDTDNLAQLKRRCPPKHKHKLALFLSLVEGQVSEVPDPYYGGDDGFETVLDLVEQGSEAWIAQLSSSSAAQD